MDRSTRVLIYALYLVAFSVGTDFVGVGVLLVPIERTFDVGVSSSQWVVTAYALAFAMMIVTGGKLADMYGRKRVLIVGLAIFSVTSLLNAFAPDIGWLIGSRVLQGLGIALVWPAAFGMLVASVPAEKSGSYIGKFIGMAGIGNVVGPLIGAGLASVADEGWRLFFVTGSALGVVSMFAIWKFGGRTATTELEKRKIDAVGVTVLSLAMFAVLFAFDSATRVGWSPVVIGLLVGAAILLLVFPVVERKVASPLIPPELWRNKPFVAGVCLNGLQIGSFFIIIVFIPQLTQKLLGLSDFASGLALLPTMILFAALSPLSGRIYDRIGPRPVMLFGYSALIVGDLLIALSPESWGYWGSVLPGMIIVGAAAGLTVGPAGTVAVSSVEQDDASLAGGIAFQFHLMAGAISVSIATLLITSAVNSSVQSEASSLDASIPVSAIRSYERTLHDSPTAEAELNQLNPQVAATVTNAVDDGYNQGFRWAFLYGAGLGLIGITLVPLLPRRERDAAERASV